MKRQLLYFLLFALVVMYACQKEKSFEQPTSPAEGSLQSDASGDCLPKTVNGVYVVGTPLVPDSNSITVDINITKSGAYQISTDTVNGFYFKATGTITTIGVNTITLKGNGTPFISGTFNFVVGFDSTMCDIQVTVLPAGSGGPAVFTLQGAPNACTGAVVAGNYALGVPLTASNTATINVDVTAIGAYTISTTYQGMMFAASGTFTTTGVQTVQLTGSGTPTTGGTNNVPVTVGSSTCSFSINVGAIASGTVNCSGAVIMGTYTAGTVLSAPNIVQISVNVTTPGVYTIHTDTVNNMWFDTTGSFISAGPTTVNLLGHGTPANQGNFTFTVKFGASTCTFIVTIQAAPSNEYFPRTVNSNWSYEIDDDASDSIYRYVISATHSALGNTFNIFMENDGISTDSSGYYRKSGSDIFEWFDAGNYLGYDNSLWAEYTLLKEAQAVNTPWYSSGFTGTVNIPPPTNFTTRFKYTILQKDVPISFTTSAGAMNFSNVIVVEEKFELFNGTTWQDVTSVLGFGKAYYARGIGLIKYEVYDPAGNLTDWQELRRYQVF